MIPLCKPPLRCGFESPRDPVVYEYVFEPLKIPGPATVSWSEEVVLVIILCLKRFCETRPIMKKGPSGPLSG